MKLNRENIVVGTVIAAGIVGMIWGAYDSYRLSKAERRAEEAEHKALLKDNLATTLKQEVFKLSEENHALKRKLAEKEES